MDGNGGKHIVTTAKGLSDRQRTCLRLVAARKTSKEIARELGLSPSTVDSHIRAAVGRLGTKDRFSAASQVVEQDEPVATAQPQTAKPHHIWSAIWSLPPVGGSPNLLSARRRAYHIVQIGLLGTMGMAAVIVTIAGLVNLFSM
jgi:DNA-binding CsgD family transcriptional regulator